MRLGVALPTLLIALLVAAGGYWQVKVGPVFYCGRVEAYPALYGLCAAALGQLALFLSLDLSPRWRMPYRLSQFAMLPFLALGLFQVLRGHAAFAAFLLAAGCIPAAIADWTGHRWVRRAPLAAFGVGTLTLLGGMAAIVQIPLTQRGVVVGDIVLVAGVAFGLVVAVIAVCSLDRYFAPAPQARDISPMLPLSLLLLAVLRAKYPDTSYDAYLYKATLPMQMADWRTGDMPIISATMLGTNFQEMLNTALIMVTGDYIPTLISTLSFGLLFCITPIAFALPKEAGARDRAIVAFAAAMAFTVTEASIAQGTSYQEPLMLLLLTAALLPGFIWPAFLAMATMVKINAGFVGPLILLVHARRDWRSVVQIRLAAVVIVAAALVVAPQIERNLTFSGRLLGQTEILGDLTDPPGPHQIMVGGLSHFDGPVRGGPLNNALKSACNMLLLNLVCSSQYDGSDVQGFHVFPGSRAPLLAVLACIVLLALAAARMASPGVAVASVAAYALAYYLVVTFMSEGRYFLPLSFGLSVLVLINREAISDLFLDGRYGLLMVAIGVFVVGSDLIPGVFNNVGWICLRGPFAAAQHQDLAAPLTPTQAFLESLARDYRKHCPPPGLPPVILGQHDKLNAPYLGVQQSHFFLTHDMDARFYAADPSRRIGIPKAVLALAYVDANEPQQILGDAVRHFHSCFADGDDHVLCSNDLAPAGPDCAQSLFP